MWHQFVVKQLFRFPQHEMVHEHAHHGCSLVLNTMLSSVYAGQDHRYASASIIIPCAGFSLSSTYNLLYLVLCPSTLLVVHPDPAAPLRFTFIHCSYLRLHHYSL